MKQRALPVVRIVTCASIHLTEMYIWYCLALVKLVNIDLFGIQMTEMVKLESCGSVGATQAPQTGTSHQEIRLSSGANIRFLARRT